MDALLRKFHAAVETGDHAHIQSVLATSVPVDSAIPAAIMEDPAKCC